jgi:hypothetical protein
MLKQKLRSSVKTQTHFPEVYGIFTSSMTQTDKLIVSKNFNYYVHNKIQFTQ